MRRLFFGFASIGLLMLALFIGLNYAQAQANSLPLTGWAWSSNIGWISFSPANNPGGGTPGSFGVSLGVPNIVGQRSLAGFAWSNNVGWVKFDPTFTGPAGQSTAGLDDRGAYLDTDGKVKGWARACSILLTNCSGNMIIDTARGGWDGWIKMSGVTASKTASYGVTMNLINGTVDGYAWGSDVVGWIDFSKVKIGAISTQNPSVTLFANPVEVDSGQTTQLTWAATNVSSCTGSSNPAGVWSGSKSIAGGTEASGAISQNTQFTISCVPVGGGNNVTANANVTIRDCTGGCCGGSCPPDKTLTLRIFGDDSARGGAQPQGLLPNCTLLPGQNQRECSYPNITSNTIQINADFINPTDYSSITWGGVPSGSIGCQRALGVSGQSLTSSCTVDMSADRIIDVYLNDDDDNNNGGNFSVDYDTITRYIRATGINVGTGYPQDYFSSTRAKLRFSNDSGAPGTLSVDVGRLRTIANGNGCEVPTGYFGTGGTNITSGTQDKEFRVRFADRCPIPSSGNNDSFVSCFTSTNNTLCTPSNKEFGGGNYPVRVIVDWTASNGTTHTKAITIPLQYIESFTQQP